MRTILLLCVVVMAMVVSAVSISRADVPNVISYQGRLTDASGVPVSGDACLIQSVFYDARGGSISSTNYRVSGTLGQTVIGLTESTSYKVRQGYWSAFARGEICCVGSTGDVNDEGSIDLSDLLWLVNYSFLGGPAPSCLATANVNGSLDCEVNLSDLLWLVNYSFLGGPAPAECLESCQWAGGREAFAADGRRPENRPAKVMTDISILRRCRSFRGRLSLFVGAVEWGGDPGEY